MFDGSTGEIEAFQFGRSRFFGRVSIGAAVMEEISGGDDHRLAFAHEVFQLADTGKPVGPSTRQVGKAENELRETFGTQTCSGFVPEEEEVIEREFVFPIVAA